MHTFNVFIDESGDEGFVFKQRPLRASSDWFIISAVIAPHPDNAVTSVIDTLRTRFRLQPKARIHFSDMTSHDRRLAMAEEIGKSKAVTITVAVHKPSLTTPETFREKSRLYFYFTRYLLERVSWYCRDARNGLPGDGSARIIFSHRGMSYAAMNEYIDELLYRGRDGGVTLEPTVIKTNQIETEQHDKLKGLQVVDAVAGCFFAALELSDLGFTEPRYARLVRPTLYTYKGRVKNYGLKIFPADCVEKLSIEPKYEVVGWCK